MGETQGEQARWARPESDADQLRACADYMTTADKAVALLSEMVGRPNPAVGHEMQDDLRRIADDLDALGIVRVDTRSDETVERVAQAIDRAVPLSLPIHVRIELNAAGRDMARAALVSLLDGAQ